MVNQLDFLFTNPSHKLLSIYFTAGYPKPGTVIETALALQESGVDFMEIGFPYSDPLADGPVIQESNQRALENGMNLKVLFEEIINIRPQIHIPILLMGYLNPVLQFGMEAFCKSCAEVGVDGIIIPDLPILEYETFYQDLFIQYNLRNIFLVTPQSKEARIRKIDELTKGFIYLLSSSSTTGKTDSLPDSVANYLQRIQNMNLTNPLMVGFGISNREAFQQVSQYASGAIVGTAFIRAQIEGKSIAEFVHELKGN